MTILAAAGALLMDAWAGRDEHALSHRVAALALGVLAHITSATVVNHSSGQRITYSQRLYVVVLLSVVIQGFEASFAVLAVEESGANLTVRLTSCLMLLASGLALVSAVAGVGACQVSRRFTGASLFLTRRAVTVNHVLYNR